jgi:uncharacterized protein
MEGRPLSIASALLLGALIGAGFATGGYFVGQGFYRARAERYVTVKGLVERDVKADLALWTIGYTAAGPDLNSANDKLEQDQAAVLAFAQSHGFPTDEIAVQPTTVSDSFANPFQNNRPDPAQRFIVKGGIQIRSTRVDEVRKASEDTGNLVKHGVALGENYPQAPQYFFTRLNDIRPPMLAEATRSARAVAEQFAADSRSRLGPIRRANQGVFEITSRDAAGGDRTGTDDQGSIDKKVRLVTTVDYYLID